MSISTIFKRKSVIVFYICYLVTYFIASWMDLATTSLGLSKSGVSEKNVLAIGDGSYSPESAWLLTAVGAIILTACILESFRNSQRVEEYWLQHPIHSFRKFYINPWSEGAIGFTPIHFLSLAIAFLILRVFAALNNLAVYWYGIGPLGGLMEIVAAKTSPLIGFSIVGFSAFLIITITVSPFAARMIAVWRKIS